MFFFLAEIFLFNQTSLTQKERLLKKCRLCGCSRTFQNGEAEEECRHPEPLKTGVGTFSGVKAKPESVMSYNYTEYGKDVLDQMARTLHQRRYGRWPVAVFYNILNLTGINAHILFKEHQQQESPRKVLQQLAEELRAEYMEGKAAATVGTRWAAAEATTTAAADTESEAVPVRKSCKRNKTLDT